MDRDPLVTAAEESLAQAKTLRRQKRFDEAAALLLASLERGTLADKIFFQLGNIYFDAGDIGRAEHSYRRATEVNPDYASAFYNLGAVYKRQKKTAASIQAQRRAMMLELLGKSRNSPTLSPEAAQWARRMSYQGILVFSCLTLFLILLLWLLQP